MRILVLLLILSVASARAAVTVSVDGNQAQATIDLPSVILGAPAFTADVELNFDNVVGLDVSALGLSAEVVDPLTLSSRLGLADLTAAFPVVISIEPTTGGALSFSGTVEVNVHTHNLNFDPAVPFRLMKSSNGGPFLDISDSVSAGSVRTRGRTGSFSDFIIAVDYRDVTTVIDAKLDRLSNLIVPIASSTVRQNLQTALGVADAEFLSGELIAAANALDGLIAATEAAALTGLPDVWSAANRSQVNTVGEIVATAKSLKFSLVTEANRQALLQSP